MTYSQNMIVIVHLSNLRLLSLGILNGYMPNWVKQNPDLYGILWIFHEIDIWTVMNPYDGATEPTKLSLTFNE